MPGEIGRRNVDRPAAGQRPFEAAPARCRCICGDLAGARGGWTAEGHPDAAAAQVAPKPPQRQWEGSGTIRRTRSLKSSAALAKPARLLRSAVGPKNLASTPSGARSALSRRHAPGHPRAPGSLHSGAADALARCSEGARTARVSAISPGQAAPAPCPGPHRCRGPSARNRCCSGNSPRTGTCRRVPCARDPGAPV